MDRVGELKRCLERTGGPACRVRDYSRLSPMLAAKLPERVADLVAMSHASDQLATCVTEASRLEVPITVRGRGTGNYGHSVPLQGGLVIETTGLDAILEIADGRARVRRA